MNIELTKQQKNALYYLVNNIREVGKKECRLGGFAGTGKAQPLDSLIITPKGFKQMGDIEIGDDICTPSGEVAKVTGIFPQGKKSIYRVWFNDGHFVECCDEHLWKCIDRRRLSNLKKYKTPYKVFPLSYIREFLTRSDGRKRFYIETSNPVEFENEMKLPIDPYLMGVLLADGSITDDNFAIHNEDQEIIDRCEKLLIDWDCKLKHKEGVTYSIVGEGKGPHSTSVNIRNALRNLEIWNCICDTKFIPSSFIYTSSNNRWELLRGLMDSDGDVDRRTGMVGYSTTSSRLAADICLLVESLGGICRIKNKDTKCVYKGKIVLGQAWILNISFNNTPDVFFLDRKKKLTKKRTKYLTKRCIREVEYVGEKEAQCIMIDHPEHLYLTDHFIPTHNTTLIKYLLHFFQDYGVAAYTGKAANVLRKKGMNESSTIHSLIYKPYFENGHVYFNLTDELPYKGLVIDESSMVSEDIYKDLKKFRVPIIFVGDHGQLEPVGSKFNLMEKPDIRLEQIHRNAGDIAKFAEHIRMGKTAQSYRSTEGKIEFKRRSSIECLMDVDQVICAYNKTRVKTNANIRSELGYTGVVNIGERVMCLRNNKRLGLFNGMQGTVTNLYEGKHRRQYMNFEFDGIHFKDVWYDPKCFGKEKADIDHTRDSPNPFDYAYCITAHKSQGDEWENVMVIEQKCKKWDHRRWAYTAASRAKNGLIWVLA